MASRFSSFIKKKLLRKDQNLISLNEPYDAMERLLKGFEITGIIDAGASNGHVSARLLRRFPSAQAYAFEPNPLYVEILEEYAGRDARFHPQFLGLSDRVGEADLRLTQSPGNTSLYDPSCGLQKIDPGGAMVRKIEKIRITTIDEWVEDVSSEIQLMKFDIQGGELKAMRGATKTLDRSVLLVYTEIMFNPMYENGAIYSQIDLCLRERGFALYDIYRPKYNHDGVLMWGNAIFVHRARLGL
ncbi:MAG: FkbM family methyltransferase [Gammaproteobacteria bacterium]|nr:FkbM family methyltransferase [Gammaproteobacteria bacterium]